jgi:HlyD family secretion protein
MGVVARMGMAVERMGTAVERLGMAGRAGSLGRRLGWPAPGRRSVIAVFLVALLGALAYWVSRAPSESGDLTTAEVARGPFTVKISETGELRALDSVTISAPNELQVIHLAPEGTVVKPGELVVRFAPGKYEGVLEEANATFQVAQADLRKAQQDRDTQRQRLAMEVAAVEVEARLAQLDLDNLMRRPLPPDLEAARMELEKAKVGFETADRKLKVLPELVDKGFVTRSALEEAELKFLEMKASLQAAQFKLEQVSAGATPEERERAEVRLKQATSALERARSATRSQLQSFDAAVDREKANVERARALIEKAAARLKTMEGRAPREGLVVYARATGERAGEKVQLGMIPFEGQPLVYLPDVSTMVADIEVNEIDIGKVTVGGPVELRLEAYPGAVFPGTVLKIGSLARLKQSRAGTASTVKIFDVTVKIDAKDPRLKPGLTAAVDVIVERQAEAISIPMSAVVARNGDYLAFVAHRGKVEARKVVLGPSNDQHVLVKEGLREGERVLLAPPASPSP